MISNAELNKFAALDLGTIKVKLMHKESGEGWSVERANAVEVEYRRFLYLAKLYPNEQMAPLLDVDIFWHYHILDTMKYAADCEQIFGYFLHHFPHVGLDGDDEVRHQEVGARMKELYAASFCQPEIDQDETQGATARFPTNAKTAWCMVERAPNQDETQRANAWFSTNAKTAWCMVERAPNQDETQGANAWFSTNAKTAWCMVELAPNQDETQRANAWFSTNAKTAWCMVERAPNQDETQGANAWFSTNGKPAWCMVTGAPSEHLRSRNPGVSPSTARFQMDLPAFAEAA